MAVIVYFTAPELPVALVRNPKCASSAIKIALWQAIDDARGVTTFDGQPHGFHGTGPWDTSPNASHGKEVFAVVRDPFKRLYSGFESKMTGRGDRVIALWRLIGGETKGDFADFIRLLSKMPPNKLNTHWRPQVINVPEKVDRIFRLEEPDVVNAYLMDKIGRSMGVFRKSQYTMPYQQAYTPELEEIVRHIYAKDFARFNYPDRIAAGTEDHVSLARPGGEMGGGAS